MSIATLPAAPFNPPQTPFQVDHDAVLRAVGLDARSPTAQALLLVCNRYGLDPILGHVVLVKNHIYVTRDGLLSVAHRHGQLDGIVVEDQGVTQTHYTARVTVFRKDMSHPFTYVGRYPKDGSNRAYGPEMAVKCAEVMALRRAFNVALCAKEELWDREDVAHAEPAPLPPEVTHAEPGVVPQQPKAKRPRDERTCTEIVDAMLQSAHDRFAATHPQAPIPALPTTYQTERHLLKHVTGKDTSGQKNNAVRRALFDAYAGPARAAIRTELKRYVDEHLDRALADYAGKPVEAPAEEESDPEVDIDAEAFRNEGGMND